MNIFLFIPFGFLLSYVLNFKLLHVFLTGLFLSALIESLQYVYGLGLCELDDVFNNTVGSLIGYGYRKFLVKQAARIKTNIQGSGGTR